MLGPIQGLGRAGKSLPVLLALLSAAPQRDFAPEVIQQRAKGIILGDTKGEHCFHEDRHPVQSLRVALRKPLPPGRQGHAILPLNWE